MKLNLPIIKGHGADNISAKASGHNGMYGHCQMNGNNNCNRQIDNKSDKIFKIKALYALHTHDIK